MLPYAHSSMKERDWLFSIYPEPQIRGSDLTVQEGRPGSAIKKNLLEVEVWVHERANGGGTLVWRSSSVSLGGVRVSCRGDWPSHWESRSTDCGHNLFSPENRCFQQRIPGLSGSIWIRFRGTRKLLKLCGRSCMCGVYSQIISGEEAFVGFSEKNLLLPPGAQEEGASRHQMYYQNLVTEKENEGRTRQDTDFLRVCCLT